MANYIGSERTNYFRVKDEAKFREWADGLSLEVITDSDGRFGLLPGSWTDDGCFPSQRGTEDEDFEEVDILGELAGHLDPSSVALKMSVGAEKLCYIVGYAEAVNHEGKVVSVSLNDIYEKAAAKFGGEVTNAEY